MRRIKPLPLVIGIAVCIALVLWFDPLGLQADSGVTELTKAESLALMNAQSALVMAQGDRDEIIAVLIAKYSVSLDTHALDIANGRFVPRVDLEEIVDETE